MRSLGTYVPVTGLPDNLQPLQDLARDLRWSWRPSLRALFTALDPEGWRSFSDHAPIVATFE